MVVLPIFAAICIQLDVLKAVFCQVELATVPTVTTTAPPPPTTAAPPPTTQNHHHHHPRPTHEAIETERHLYKYDPNSHLMMALTGQTCYIYTMTEIEAQSVHTVQGIHSVELKMLTLIADTKTTHPTSTRDELKQMSTTLLHACGHHDIYKLNSDTILVTVN